MARPVLAVLAGIVTTVGIVTVCTYLAIVALLETGPGGLVPYATSGFIFASLAYSFVGGFAGGLVTARIARRDATMLGGLVGVILYVPIFLSGGLPGPGQPNWYPWAFGGIVLFGTATGAYFVARAA